MRLSGFLKANRGDGTRTHGLCVPNAALYQTEPRLDATIIFYQIINIMSRFFWIFFDRFLKLKYRDKNNPDRCLLCICPGLLRLLSKNIRSRVILFLYLLLLCPCSCCLLLLYLWYHSYSQILLASLLAVQSVQ